LAIPPDRQRFPFRFDRRVKAKSPAGRIVEKREALVDAGADRVRREAPRFARVFSLCKNLGASSALNARTKSLKYRRFGSSAQNSTAHAGTAIWSADRNATRAKKTRFYSVTR
jgi:hypothetical protein